MTTLWNWTRDEAAWRYVSPLAAFLLTLLVLLYARRSMIGWLYAHSSGEQTFGRVVIDTLRFPSLLWCIAGAVAIGLEISIIPDTYTVRASQAIIAFLIVSLSMVLASASVRAVTMHGRRHGVALALSGMARTLIRVVIFTCGATAVLGLYRVNITPLLTALGVGGLALALALQDSLANFFAGIHILIEEPIRLGSVIRLSTGEEGIVTDIGWRTTRVRNGANNIVVIPNTKITSGILTNYNLPDARVTADVAVIVGFDADVDRVRRIALDETRACDGVLEAPPPSIFFNPGATLTHLQFTVVFSVAEFARRGPTQSEVRLRIHRRLRAEAIPTPPVAADLKALVQD